MFGVAAAPIFDSKGRTPDFAHTMVLFRPGDIVVFRPIDQQEYEQIQVEVEAGTYRYRMADVDFDVTASLQDPESYNVQIMEALNHA